MRTIDADKMILRYQSHPNRHSKTYLSCITYEDVLDAVIYDLEQEPTVDAEPVKHGHWIGDFCSECGKDALCDCDKYEIYGTIHSDYCPHCGAKMDEEVRT